MPFGLVNAPVTFQAMIHKKSVFHTIKVEFLGYIVNTKGVTMSE
ncbi:unnamed protein product [Tuber melanosporum]|uniref:(Perigord truffle) hypothetical protein n=1 Tax=Tuber melanosporum (strain Mel28) TaxID=656061 RepID=D5G6K4_TUBMM|nr:uncharacterized protein GSTUM_00001803001 [Tuber melanosporum]CAZ80147.1 unnamed protein product [Tuber melanosporum]